jgi:hypothetical protein
MPRWQGFIGGSNVSQSLIADCERTVNLYIETAQSEGAKSPKGLFATPGFQRWTGGAASGVANVGGRASLYANGRLFQLWGFGFYEIMADGTCTLRGAIAQDANPGQMIFNGIVGGQIGIASGGAVYSFVLATNVFAATTLVAGISHLAYAAGFGLAFQVTTGKVFLSNLNDVTVWNAGTFFQRSLFADPYQAMFVDANNLVWMIGTDTFEVRYNSGVGTQPFVPLSGLVGAYGIAAPFAYARSAKGNFWLARNAEGIGEFVVTTGAGPQSVSTYAIDTAIAGFLRTSRIDDAEVLPYQQEGHTFICLSLPSVPATLVYDVEGQNWTERGKWNAMQGRYDLWAPRTHVEAFGKHLIGERTTGNLYAMDTAYATEIDGTGIRVLRRAPARSNERRREPISQLELVVDNGVGLATGQGSDPTVMLRVSEDGGRTWGNQLDASFGRIGEFQHRVYWTALGCSQFGDTTFEVTCSDPVPKRFIDALINNDSGQRAA